MWNRKPKDKSSSLRKQEFVLVVIMLGSLAVIIALIFWWNQGLLSAWTTMPTVTTVTTDPVTKATTTKTTIDTDLIAAVLNQRKDLIALMLGAFGAWIGAGAAYFFGRENMREATSSILKMKGATPAEILMQTTVADLKPKPLPRTFKIDDEKDKKVSEILGWLEKDPELFFATIVDAQGKMLYAIDEEAIYRYIAAGDDTPVVDATKVPPEKLKKYDKATSEIGDVVKFVEGQEGFISSKAWKNLINTTSKVNQNSSCALADEKMAEEQKIVAIVVDDKGIPVGYIKSAEIWKLVSSRTSA